MYEFFLVREKNACMTKDNGIGVSVIGQRHVYLGTKTKYSYSLAHLSAKAFFPPG